MLQDVSVPSLPASIYGEQIYKAGHGYGLYEPQREVHPGDVGFLRDGSVIVLFNITRDGNDPYQRRGVPNGFKKLDPPESMWKSNREWHTRPVSITSETRVTRHTGMDASVDIAATSVQFQFAYTSMCGAALVTRCPTSRVDILLQSEVAKEYILAHIDSWYAFASENGFDLQEGELFLVRGCDKTAAWSLAVFSGSATGVSFEFRGEYPREASTDRLLDGEWINLPNHANQRTGPALHPPSSPTNAHCDMSILPGDAPAEDLPFIAPPPCTHDQTLFIRILKAKRRRPFPYKFKAATEPQDPTSNGGDSSSGESSPSEGYVGAFATNELFSAYCVDKVSHPLDTLVDYILENSDCNVAIADDDDFYQLLEPAVEGKASMEQCLQRLLPSIQVSKNGVNGDVGFLNHELFCPEAIKPVYNAQIQAEQSSASGNIDRAFPGPRYAHPIQGMVYSGSRDPTSHLEALPSVAVHAEMETPLPHHPIYRPGLGVPSGLGEEIVYPRASSPPQPTEPDPVVITSEVEGRHRCRWGNCDGWFGESDQDIRQHFREAHDLPPRQQRVCQWGACGMANREVREHTWRHIRSHAQTQVATCPVCGRLFNREDSITQHMNNHHIS